PLDTAGRERLERLRVTLLEDLRKGLELLGGYPDDVTRRLLRELVACQHAIQGHQPELAARLNLPLPESPLGTLLGEDEEVAPSLPPTPQSGLSDQAKTIARQLESLE